MGRVAGQRCGDMGLRDTMYKIDKKQGYSTGIIATICNNFKWSITYKNTESLCCISETNIVNQLYFNKKLELKI